MKRNPMSDVIAKAITRRVRPGALSTMESNHLTETYRLAEDIRRALIAAGYGDKALHTWFVWLLVYSAAMAAVLLAGLLAARFAS